jgi:hypothetical protein
MLLKEQIYDQQEKDYDEKCNKLAGEIRQIKHIQESKTLVNLYPEMHAIPSHIQKQWEQHTG